MVIMTHAKFHFHRLMLTLIFGIRASEPPPPGPGERQKRPGLIGLKSTFLNAESPCSSVAEWLRRRVSARGIFMSAWVRIPDGSFTYLLELAWG